MTTQKFAFGREFKTAPGVVVPLETPEATLTRGQHEALLAAAVEQARQQGLAAGLAEGRREQSARLAGALESVSANLSLAVERLDGISHAAADEAVHFAQAFATCLAGRLLAKDPALALEEAARALFTDLMGAAHVAVRVAPPLVEVARDRLQALARERGYEGRLIVLGEPEILPGDVRIEWADGGLIRDQAALARAVADTVTRIMGRPAPAPHPGFNTEGQPQ
jgi:flagellar assembly protein FliH